MLTEKVNACLQLALNEDKVAKAIKERDNHSDFRLKSFCTKIMKRKGDSNFFKMIVRVGLDYLQKVQDEDIKEDIIVDVSYIFNRNTKEERFKILKVVFVPELPNP